MRARAVLATPAAAVVLLAACGSEETNPPPAEPTASPPPAERPAGRVVELDGEAEGVAVDPRSGLAAIALRDPDRLAVLDVERGRVVRDVETPESARHLSLALDDTILAPIEYVDTLVRVDLRTGRTTEAATGDFPHDAAEAPNGRIFVGDEGGDTVTVLEGERLVDRLPAPEQPGGVAVSGDVLAVVAVAAREVAFYDTNTLEQLAVLPAGAGPSHIVAGPDGRFYVTDTGGDALLVYEGEGPKGPRLLDRTNVPDSPYGIAGDFARDRLWVTRTGANRVEELEITDLAPKIVGGYPTVRQPNSVAVDERTGIVVVAGRTPGTVQVIERAARP